MRRVDFHVSNDRRLCQPRWDLSEIKLCDRHGACRFRPSIVLALPDTDATELSVPFGAAHGEQIDLGSGEIAPVAMENDNAVSVIVPMSNGVAFPVLIIPG